MRPQEGRCKVGHFSRPHGPLQLLNPIPAEVGIQRPEQRPERPQKPPRREPPRQERPPQPCSADNFLRNLLPKDLDTGDLLVIILLLLMASDGHGNGNNALLTLALYLFL